MESVTGHVLWKLEWPIRGWWLASFLMAGSTREGVDIRWDEWNRLRPEAASPPPRQCVRTRINRRNQSRTSIGLRESPLSPWSQFNPGGLSNTGSQRPHDYPTSRELSACRSSLSLWPLFHSTGFHPFVRCARGVSIVWIRCTQDKEWARTASSKTNALPSVKLGLCSLEISLELGFCIWISIDSFCRKFLIVRKDKKNIKLGIKFKKSTR